MATKVKLRKKKIKNGRESLYLDFYPPILHSETGEPTRRKFLGLYIFEKPRSPIDKKHNSETWLIGESMRQKQENILNKPEIYNDFEKQQLRIKELGEQCFLRYFKDLIKKRNRSNNQNWTAALKHLENFTQSSLKFHDLNESLLEDFKEYLLKTKRLRSKELKISQNSASSYFNKIKAALKQSYKDGILQSDLSSKINSIKTIDSRREYLTLTELNNLAKTPCQIPIIKKAALFSALTGMAFKEIQNLVWSHVSFIENEGYQILTKRQKTNRDNYLPISDQAFQLLGEPGKPDSKIFIGLHYSAYNNELLLEWVKQAGINKKITFHCFRHTYATLQLYNGTDIYTVSKMLGHKNIQTTEIYTKIVDQSKRAAANKIILKI